MAVWHEWAGGWRKRLSLGLVGALAALALVGCGGSASLEEGPTVSAQSVRGAPPSAASLLPAGNAGFQTVLSAVPPQVGIGGPNDVPTSLTIHYQRDNGDTAGWQVHTWGAGRDPGWNQGHNAVGQDSFGAVYEIPLASNAGTVGYLFHRFDDKDHSGADQSYTLKPGKNEIWRRQNDPVTYTSRPAGGASPVQDLRQVRVHYKRFDANYSAWGLHLWASSGLDAARMPPNVTIDQWGNAVGFDRMPGYAQGAGEVVFDIPVLNPKDDAGRTQLEFIVHGKAPNENDKDGRNDNIRVRFPQLSVANQTGEIWLVQGDPTVYYSPPDLRRVSTTDARAFFLNKDFIQWPANDGSGVVKLYRSTRGQLVVVKGEAVRGHEGFQELTPYTGAVPAAATERFKWIGSGARFQLPAKYVARLPEFLRGQLVLVQEDASGKVQNATTLQLPGALDDIYASAEREQELGVTIKGGSTHWKLWAPTAQRVLLFTYPDATGAAESVMDATLNPSTGIWSASRPGDLTGKTYRFGVEVFVRGIGVVRNLVTDPYSVSLSANGQRSWVGSLSAPALKPAGWDASRAPAKVAATPDMSIYELHVRDFSINDTSVSSANRGKYLAFTESSSRGMQHLKGLADAGLTDVHLLPVYDLVSVNEAGCTTPNVPNAAPDSEEQQAAVQAERGSDCFNWGYDPHHFNAPDGSYASQANDGAQRVLEFRRMVMGLHGAGLRVGLDVVYNHTSASGQTQTSVLDRVVPGYYHRYNESGDIERSTCCENTATENLMMGKLMSDSVLLWAREYKISSFRFDIMGHQPRSVMEAMQARLRTELGREVQFLGEGWNFGEVADGRRFVQASMWSLNGSGIGTFSPFARDAIRGGGPMDGGNALVANQGFVNGLWYDPNPQGALKSRNELMWFGDLIKAGLAGSIRSYTLQAHWGETKRLEELNGAGYVVEPGEAVNYIENHDNQTLFDNNAFKLPTSTSRDDRARVQILAAALNTFSQGVAYFHAGVDTLRSKSLDRNGYDSGDWFNRIDWTYSDNYYGVGAPLRSENGDNYFVMKPLLANPLIKPTGDEIAWTRDAFRDLLKIRASTTLLRLRSAADIKSRLVFHNVGPSQEATVIVGAVDGAGYPGANFGGLVYLVNVDKQPKQLTLAALKNKGYQLHPVHRAAGAADQRVATQAAYDDATGRFSIPARSAVVFVRN